MCSLVICESQKLYLGVLGISWASALSVGLELVCSKVWNYRFFLVTVGSLNHPGNAGHVGSLAISEAWRPHQGTTFSSLKAPDVETHTYHLSICSKSNTQAEISLLGTELSKAYCFPQTFLQLLSIIYNLYLILVFLSSGSSIKWSPQFCYRVAGQESLSIFWPYSCYLPQELKQTSTWWQDNIAFFFFGQEWVLFEAILHGCIISEKQCRTLLPPYPCAHCLSCLHVDNWSPQKAVLLVHSILSL